MENRIEILRKYIENFLFEKTDEIMLRFVQLNHMYSVSQFCAMIALKRGENAELAMMAGLLHDFHTFLTLEPENHAEKGAILAKEVLEKLKITADDETDKICSAIRSHSSKNSVQSAFAEVLIDADVMQHCLFNVTIPVSEREKNRFEKLVKEFSLKN